MSGAAVAIGDIFVDYITEIPVAYTSFGSRPELDTSAPITRAAGGGSLQFAIAAAQADFCPSYCLGRVGGQEDDLDADARHVSRKARAANVEPIWTCDSLSGTGRCMILYLPQGQRIMVSDAGANASFSAEDITDRMRAIVAAASLVHVSGYALISNARRAATLQLMRAGKAGGAMIAVDLAPHNLHLLTDGNALLAELHGICDWMIASHVTARGLLGMQESGTEPRAAYSLDAVVAGLSRWSDSVAVFDHPGRARVYSGGDYSIFECHYESGCASRGQSAQAQATLLARYLGPTA